MKQKRKDWLLCAVLLCGLLMLAGCGGQQVPVLIPVPIQGSLGGDTEAPAPEAPKDEGDAGQKEEPAGSETPEGPAESETPAGSGETPEEPEQAKLPRLTITAKRKVPAVYGETAGELVIVQLRAENDTGKPVSFHNTLAALGGVTTKTAWEEPLCADALLEAEPMEGLLAWVTTDLAREEAPRQVVLAVEGPEAVLEPEQTAVVYAYLFVPEANGSCRQVDLLQNEEKLAYVTFRA